MLNKTRSDLIGFVFRIITLRAMWRKRGGELEGREQVRSMLSSPMLEHS